MKRTRPVRWPLAALAASVLLGGCVSGEEMEAMRRDSANLRREMAQISKSSEANRSLTDERLQRLEREITGRVEETLKEGEGSRVALNQRIEELAIETRFVQGKLEEQASMLRELQSRVDENTQETRRVGVTVGGLEQQMKLADQQAKQVEGQVKAMEQQVRTLEQQPPRAAAPAETAPFPGQTFGTVLSGPPPATPILPLQPAGPAVPPPLPTAALPSGIPPAPAPPTAPAAPLPEIPPTGIPPVVAPPVASLPAPRPQPVLPPEELYKTALSDYTKGDYDLAIEGFRDYIRTYPKTSLTANAQYWLGESYFSQKNYAQAVEEFNTVIQDYPDNPKVPSALFKQGDAYLQLGDTRQGTAVLCELIAKHPRTREARLAKERNLRCR